MRRGLGRAVLYLETNDSRVHRDTILDACLHDWRWDRQIEDARAPYLFDVLHATGEPSWYAERLRPTLLSGDSGADLYQVFELAALLARGGEDKLRPALSIAFERHAANGEDLGSDTLIVLDGYDGYACVARTFLKYPRPEDELWRDHLRLDDLIQRNGESSTRQFTADLLQSEPGLSPYFVRVWQEWTEWKAELAAGRKQPLRLSGYDSIRAEIESPKRSVRPWSRKLDDATFLRLSQDFLVEQNPERLKKYLYQFRWQPFPLEPARLIELARGEPKNVLTIRAISALERISHPDIRALALEFVSKDADAWRGVGLLVQNPGHGDAALIHSIIARQDSFDEWEYHRMSSIAREYFEAHPSPEAVPSLIALYENGICGLCRSSVIDILIELGVLPQWMRDECRYDSYSYTRQTVASAPANCGE